MLNMPVPVPIFSGGTAPKAIFITAGELTPIVRPSTSTTAMISHSGVRASIVSSSSTPASVPASAAMQMVRGS